MPPTETAEKRVQRHLVLPYKQQPREHPIVRSFLDRGFRIAQLQRLSDQEVVVTFAADRAGG